MERFPRDATVNCYTAYQQHGQIQFSPGIHLEREDRVSLGSLSCNGMGKSIVIPVTGDVHKLSRDGREWVISCNPIRTTSGSLILTKEEAADPRALVLFDIKPFLGNSPSLPMKKFRGCEDGYCEEDLGFPQNARSLEQGINSDSTIQALCILPVGIELCWFLPVPGQSARKIITWKDGALSVQQLEEYRLRRDVPPWTTTYLWFSPEERKNTSR